ncbi:MAG TPA: hypothetical protein VKE51_08820 [Vicinamibacterales bacterium]|nr:hypothetical protein [Vicinamibacterales bacterium]
MSHDSVSVSLGSARASFNLTTDVFDDHDLKSSLTKVFPSGFPQIASVTFAVEWGGAVDHQHVRNEAMNFEGDFYATGSTIEWSSSNASSGFQFTSEPANPARLIGAVIGHERSGVFFK